MEFQLPELGEGVYEAEMTRWLVHVGDRVAPGQGLVEVLTDKATMEVPSPFAGVISKLGVEPGQNLKVGQAILSYDPLDNGVEPSAVAQKPTSASPDVASPATASRGNGVKASPAVRQKAKQLGIDLAQIRGTGPNGRILEGDLIVPETKVASAPVAAPPAEFGRPGTRIKLQGLRRKIAEHMVLAKSTIPHYSYVDECDVTELVRVRVGLRNSFEKKGAKLTYLAFIVKAVVGALKDVPMVNATLDDAAGDIVLLDQYHIGIAVATPAGLVVPVVRDADRKSLLDIARDIQRLGDEARAGKSRLEDQRGATFTVTSFGSIGGLFAAPVIPFPQLGILGVGKIVKRPVYDAAGHVVPADMVYLSYSFDHRVLDGALAAAFSNALIARLQKPLELAMGEVL